MKTLYRSLLVSIGTFALAGTSYAQVPSTNDTSDGNNNTGSGSATLSSLTTGNSNSAFGALALAFNTIGSNNTASGVQALEADTSGSQNTASGYQALASNTTGPSNTASGFSALVFNTTGGNNTAYGSLALYPNKTGNNNIAVGYRAGFNTVLSNNIEIGHAGLAADTGVIRIGTQGTQRFTQIAGIWNTVVKSGQAVVVNSKGQIGVASTKIVSVANPATQDDVAALRAELAAAKNMIYSLQREMTALKSRVH